MLFDIAERLFLPAGGKQDCAQSEESSVEVCRRSRGALVSPHWQSQPCCGCQHWAGYTCSQWPFFGKSRMGRMACRRASCLAFLFSLLIYLNYDLGEVWAL